MTVTQGQNVLDTFAGLWIFSTSEAEKP